MRSLVWSLWLTLCVGSPAQPLQAADSVGPLEDVTFLARCDGSTQRYVVLTPPGFQTSVAHDVLIALHGHGSDRWQFVTSDRDECRAVRDVAAARQMRLVAPDYRAKTSWMGPQAEADVVQIITELRQRPAVRRVFLCGASMGGSASLTFAALHPELIDGVASMNGTANHLEYENFQDAIQQSFGGSKSEKPAEYKLRSAEYWPEKLTMPIGITAGGQDTVVPPASVVRLAGVLTTLQRDVHVIYRADGGHQTNYADARRVLEFVLDRARPWEPARPER
ncbi:MAG TPA: alpha/beta fold hydrolase [Planctomycetaceae bacterium]|nr:alpha/beta fold hydrolase [Planctomycetaceae bacterium]